MYAGLELSSSSRQSLDKQHLQATHICLFNITGTLYRIRHTFIWSTRNITQIQYQSPIASLHLHDYHKIQYLYILYYFWFTYDENECEPEKKE